MSKNNKPKGKPGTWVERDLYISRAFHALGGFAPQLLIMLLGERFIKRTTGECTNLDKITMPYAKLENIYNSTQGMSEGMKKLVTAGMRSRKKDGISRPRIIRAWDDLLAKGFIKITHQGGAWQQDKSTYGLVDDWRSWKPGKVFRERPKDTRTLGYRKPKVEVKAESSIRTRYPPTRVKSLPIRTQTIQSKDNGNVTREAVINIIKSTRWG